MNEKVKLILSLSISGSILAGAILALKPIFRHKLSKSFQYYIWIVVLLRLVMPFSFETSIMNKMFYISSIPAVAQVETKSITPSVGNAAVPAAAQETTTREETFQSLSSIRSLDLKTLFSNNILNIWLIGMLAALAANLWGYARFIKHLKAENRPARHEENELLKELLNGRNRAVLVRNKFTATPMLIGIIKPCVVIPDVDFSQKQLKYILLHEITHLRRFDIGVKWLTVAASSIHWFNPMVYFMKREINHACELSCDEGVIQNLGNGDKQEYGDTLISVAAEYKYPTAILSTTMCEEKKTLKERLISIMNHSKKSRFITIMSAVLLVLAICSAVVLGAGVGINSKLPPDIYISMESQKTKKAIRGGYSWKNRGQVILTDTAHPKTFEYKNENIVSVTGREQLILGTQKLKSDKKYSFTIEKIEVYKNNQLIKINSAEPSFLNGILYLQAPEDPGEYIYCLLLNFKGRGTVNYGFVARVDMATYDLTEIEKFKTPYIGNHNKVMNIASLLPVPDSHFKQQYFSMKTSSRPYMLNVYYESFSNNGYAGQWPIPPSDTLTYNVMQKNALVLFYMVDNLDEVTFAFRNSPSTGGLDTSKYDSYSKFTRVGIELEYGKQVFNSKDIKMLQDILEGKTDSLNDKIDVYLSTIISSPLAYSYTVAYIAAHQKEYDAIVGMSEAALPHLISILESGEKGLRVSIVETICNDIIDKLNRNNSVNTETKKLIERTQVAINKRHNYLRNGTK